MESGSLQLFVAEKQLSHEKTYLLEADDGRKRVITGSANLSNAAFSARQRENICFFDGEQAFDWYFYAFQTLRDNSSAEISKKALAFADSGEHIDALPIAEQVKVKKALVIEPMPVHDETARFALEVKELSKTLSPMMPQNDKKGKITLLPETIANMKRRIVETITHEKELRGEYPELVFDTDAGTALLNGKTLDLQPEKEGVANDAALFLEYMAGFEKFYGDVAYMQARYFELTNWFFASPFMAVLRTTASLYNHNIFPYPVFALIYGQSKAGKTSFIETLLKMMIGQKPKIENRDFTRSNIDGLKRKVQGVPITVNDIDNARFTQHAVELVKNDEFGIADKLTGYPAVIITANEDVKVVAPELVRRMAIFRLQAGIKNTEIMQSNIVRRVQKNIGTAFYREYLRRMLGEVAGMLDALRSEEDTRPPDILAASSVVINDIIRESAALANAGTDAATPNAPAAVSASAPASATAVGAQTPVFVRKLSLEDYFGDQVTGSLAIKTVRDAWRIDKKRFVVDKRLDELRYNAGQNYDAARIIKELPEDLEPRQSREWVCMNLARAKALFDINFKKGLF
jgi:hypothetical protein